MKLTTREAAELLGITNDSLRRWRVYGAGPSYEKVRGRCFYDKADVLKWIKKNTVKVKEGYATKDYLAR